MRIIAGNNKAKRLNSPKTDKSRPTLDRVKEAMFSILMHDVNNANVLDLFSGTGNLGLESISRGAKFAWLNDMEKTCISTIISNTKLTKSDKYVKITNKDYIKCLNQVMKENIMFDIVFLDPPYDSKYGINSLEFISKNPENILSKDGIIVYETDKTFVSKATKNDKDIFDSFGKLKCIDTKKYGNIILMLYKWG